MLTRLKDDFHLAMLTFVGLVIPLCLTPYGIYRLMNGNILVGLADLVIVTCSIIATVMAWKTGDTVKSGMFMAISFCACAVLICINVGVDGLFWMYPLLIFLFFLVPPARAVMLVIAMMLALYAYSLIFELRVFNSYFQMLTFFITTTLASSFAFMFAYRSLAQRRELQRLATTDSLTGASNRRTLNDRLASAITDFNKNTRQYGLILLDLDHFKQINDRYGHKMGDKVLMDLIPVVRSMIRKHDQVFRFGGEEFVVLLADTTLDDLQRLAEKLRVAVQSHMNLPDGTKLTTSIGIAHLKAGEDWENWLHRADMALYKAKEQGRNQVVMA